MHYLYILIFLLSFLLILLIAKLVSGKRVLSSFAVILIIITTSAAGFIFDPVHLSLYAKAVNQMRSTMTEGHAVATNLEIEETFPFSIIEMKDSVLLDTPVIRQMPELPRGCEVTSLAMLLQHAGVTVDKMTLAENVEKDPTPFNVENGITYFGHPNNGFVGDMYSFKNPGLGVYHKPIADLAEIYLPGMIKDLTGFQFEELKLQLSDNRPVWVIINSTYKKLPPSQFKTWHTPNGIIEITRKEHSVLLTGFDHEYIYFNDPLSGEKNKKAPLKDFEESWVQMGSQAITYIYPRAESALEL